MSVAGLQSVPERAQDGRYLTSRCAIRACVLGPRLVDAPSMLYCNKKRPLTDRVSTQPTEGTDG
jgi:hypothetical protein